MCPAISLEAVFPLRLVLRRARPGILELPSPSASDEWTYHRGRWRSGWAGPATVPRGSDLPQLAPEQVSHMIIHLINGLTSGSLEIGYSVSRANNPTTPPAFS